MGFAHTLVIHTLADPHKQDSARRVYRQTGYVDGYASLPLNRNHRR